MRGRTRTLISTLSSFLRTPELLALRKAARKNQDVSTSRSKGKEGKTKGGGARDAIPKDSPQDVPAETSSSSVSTAGKKAKGKKTKTKAGSPPLSPTVAHLGGMKSLAGASSSPARHTVARICCGSIVSFVRPCIRSLGRRGAIRVESRVRVGVGFANRVRPSGCLSVRIMKS